MEGRRIYVKHPSYSDELYHHGVAGMSWHKRLYQYEDGSLTPLGRVHYGIGQARAKSKAAKEAKAKAKAEAQAAKDRAKYQNEDGTLNRRGMVKYKTTDKYALMTDDEIRQQTQRLQLQKNLEDMKKQTSAGYRIANKLTTAAEDVLVAGYKKGAEKLVNHFVDEAVSSFLHVDKDKAAKLREFAEPLSNMKTSQIQETNKRRAAVEKMYKDQTGEDLPKDFKIPDYVEPKKENESPVSENKPEPKPEVKSESKQEQKQNTDDKSKNNMKPNESKKEASEPKSEDKPAESKPLMNKKTPSMKEVKDKPSVRIHRFNMKEKMEKAEKDTNRAERAYGINPARISSMHSSGMTIEEIAKKLNISTSTVQKYM